MAEFNECGLWMKLTFLTTTIGFILDLFGMSMGLSLAQAYGGSWTGSDACGLLVAGFLFFLTATALVLVIVHLDELKSSKPSLIAFIVFGFFAGLLTIIGIAVYNGRYANNLPYATMVAVLGSLLIILAAIFAVLDLVGVKAGGGGGGKAGASSPSPDA